MWKTYKEKNIPHSRRTNTSPSVSDVNTQKYGIDSSNFRGSALYNNLPTKFKKFNFLQ